MASGETAPSLPEIPRAKQGLVESSGKRGAFARVGGLADSGLDLRDSTAASSRSNSASASARPQPGGLLVRSSPLPLSPRPPSPMRRVSVPLRQGHVSRSCSFSRKTLSFLMLCGLFSSPCTFSELMLSVALPRAPLAGAQSPGEYVRTSRSELERKEQSLALLRWG